MTSTRERLVAAAALVLSVLVLATSVEAGRTLVDALITAAASYGTAVLAAVLVLALMGAPVSIRPILKATRTVVTAAVVIGLLLYGTGKSLWAVIV